MGSYDGSLNDLDNYKTKIRQKFEEISALPHNYEMYYPHSPMYYFIEFLKKHKNWKEKPIDDENIDSNNNNTILFKDFIKLFQTYDDKKKDLEKNYIFVESSADDYVNVFVKSQFENHKSLIYFIDNYDILAKDVSQFRTPVPITGETNIQHAITQSYYFPTYQESLRIFNMEVVNYNNKLKKFTKWYKHNQYQILKDQVNDIRYQDSDPTIIDILTTGDDFNSKLNSRNSQRLWDIGNTMDKYNTQTLSNAQNFRRSYLRDASEVTMPPGFVNFNKFKQSAGDVKQMEGVMNPMLQKLDSDQYFELAKDNNRTNFLRDAVKSFNFSRKKKKGKKGSKKSKGRKKAKKFGSIKKRSRKFGSRKRKFGSKRKNRFGYPAKPAWKFIMDDYNDVSMYGKGLMNTNPIAQ